MNWKYFKIAAIVIAVAAVVFYTVAIGATFVAMLSSLDNLPSGVSTTRSSITPVTPTVTAPPTGTVTETPKPIWPTETAETMNPPTPTSESCSQGGLSPSDWDTNEDMGNDKHMVPGGVFDVSPTAGYCYDTIVFNIDTLDQAGFVAKYVPEVTYDASGEPVPLFGLADMQLTIFAPVNNIELWKGYEFRAASDEYSSLRNIKFAGSFEGVTTFGIGVQEEVPFAVDYSNDGSSGTGKVIVHLARVQS